MRFYQVVFEVPDDFDPDQLNMSIHYEKNPEETIAMCHEGFIGDFCYEQILDDYDK